MPPRTRASVPDEAGDVNVSSEFKQVLGKFLLSSTATDEKTVSRTGTKVTSTKAVRKRSSPSSKSGTPTKKQRPSSSYAPPSKYAHLKGVTDSIAPDLLVLLVGHNPGVATATSGHAYAHPSNHFWRLLYASGLTDRRCLPREDGDMPELYSLGLTNIVARPTKDTAELSKDEQAGGSPILDEKVRRYRPEVVCMVGKSIWEAVWRHKYGRNPRKEEFKYGWQDEKHNMGVVEEDSGEYGAKWAGARVFVTTTTSGLAAGMKPAEKEAIWKPLGDWAKQRRTERAAAAISSAKDEGRGSGRK